MRVAYRPLNERQFMEHLHKDVGDILAMGSGLGDINIFKKHHLTKGSGAFSNFILKYGKKILPYVKNLLWPAAKEFGGEVMDDITSGKHSLKTSLKKRGLKKLAKVGQRIITGEGRTTRRRRRTLRRKCKKNMTTKAGRVCKRRRRRRKRSTRNVASKGGATKKRVRHAKRKSTGGARRKPRAAKKRSTRKRVIKPSKITRSKTMRSMDCSRPGARKLCAKDIFGM